MRQTDRVRRIGTLALVAGLSFSCSSSSGGGGGGAAGAGEFQLERISLRNNEIWEINREIEFEFTRPVDFASVSSNTINIETDRGVPATGSFSFKRTDTDGDGILDTVDDTIIVWQPNCPVAADASDAGLLPLDRLPDGAFYVITVVGASSGTANTIRSTAGRPLEVTQTREFTTPADLSSAYLDEVFGEPLPVVRIAGTAVTDSVSYVQIGPGDDPANRLFFEFDPTTQTFSTVPGPGAPTELPLNRYSDTDSQIAFVIEFNQAISPAAINVSSTRLRLEYEDAAGDWFPIETVVELLGNCTSAGATVRLTPIGLLPAASRFRAVVLPGFQDIVGETSLTGVDDFAVAPTETITFASLGNPTDGADEFIEDFDFADFQDGDVLFDTPAAVWEGGRLVSSFDFGGSGGPGGTFDWTIRTGETFVFDTATTTIVGGDGDVRDTVQTSINGIVDVRNLTIQPGGVLRVQGNNTMLVNATGTVRIDGIFDVSGYDAMDVSTVNAGDQPTVGGAGTAGGGDGGGASENINASTAVGGRGDGPFGMRNQGGFGGESGYADPTLGKDARRPGGGGGGRFGLNAAFNDPTGLTATAGLSGAEDSRSAVSGASPSLGGAVGGGAFSDDDDTNNAFGSIPSITYDAGTGDGTITAITRGELSELWAGYGGGGGGDAIPSMVFPQADWEPASDERGGGGGGGGGGLRIRALGPIVFGHTGGVIGQILVEGGSGGAGENTFLLDHIGGSGGSGSGGHLMLESASFVDFTDGDPTFADPGVDFLSARGGPQVTGSTLDIGEDPIPEDISYGGSGGPGLIQLHVPRFRAPSDTGGLAGSDIILPDYADDVSFDPDTDNFANREEKEIDQISSPFARVMIPTFGPRSQARSAWIPVGGADVNPAGGSDLVQFLFQGTETTVGADEGKVLTTTETVDELTPILGPEAVSAATVAVLSDGVTLSVSGASLDPLINSLATPSQDLYLRAPSLLRHFTLRMTDSSAPTTRSDFEVVSAAYDDAATILTITVDGSAGTLADFAASAATPEYELIPRFFRVSTDGTLDSLLDSSFVRITFEGAAADASGNPDETALLVPATGDVGNFNALAAGQLKFFRFLVEFDLDAMAVGVSEDTKRVELEFLKLPFVF